VLRETAAIARDVGKRVRLVVGGGAAIRNRPALERRGYTVVSDIAAMRDALGRLR
jgi:hypothetical protein